MLVRCSSLGKIMTDARSKKEVLSQTAKQCIEDIFDEKELDSPNEFWSRYTDKGTKQEQDSIDLCNEVLDYGFLYKNSERFTNDFITGEPDILNDKVLIDIKTSWDTSTYPLHTKKTLKKLNKMYYYQLMGYMWLTGKRKAYVAYCLIDTPEDILQDEIRREHWKQKKIDEDSELINFINKKHKPSLNKKYPKKKRVKLFEVKYKKQEIEAIKTRIEACREYYEELKINLQKENQIIKDES